ITGGPGSGKTTLIEELRARGYSVVGESAQLVMDTLTNFLGSEENQAKWRDGNQQWCQNEIAKISIYQNRAMDELIRTKALNDGDFIFFDRGLHDSLAYIQKLELLEPEELIKACQNISYDWVFVLEPPA